MSQPLAIWVIVTYEVEAGPTPRLGRCSMWPPPASAVGGFIPHESPAGPVSGAREVRRGFVGTFPLDSIDAFFPTA